MTEKQFASFIVKLWRLRQRFDRLQQAAAGGEVPMAISAHAIKETQKEIETLLRGFLRAKRS